MPSIDLIGLVPPKLGAGEIADLCRVDDADDMACGVQG
jgi:hypothetical protein